MRRYPPPSPSQGIIDQLYTSIISWKIYPTMMNRLGFQDITTTHLYDPTGAHDTNEKKAAFVKSLVALYRGDCPDDLPVGSTCHLQCAPGKVHRDYLRTKRVDESKETGPAYTCTCDGYPIEQRYALLDPSKPKQAAKAQDLKLWMDDIDLDEDFPNKPSKFGANLPVSHKVPFGGKWASGEDPSWCSDPPAA